MSNTTELYKVESRIAFRNKLLQTTGHTCKICRCHFFSELARDESCASCDRIIADKTEELMKQARTLRGRQLRGLIENALSCSVPLNKTLCPICEMPKAKTNAASKKLTDNRSGCGWTP